ncbi:MAG: bactofilin family protein [Alphaproteobacteria bacterium]
MLLRQKDDGGGSAPPMKPFSSKGGHGPSKPPTKAPAIAATPKQHSADIPTSAARADSKTLIVGRDIRLAGEITECDRLIVEGHVQVTLSDARLIEVANNGYFKGRADVIDADISGRFDGELTAKNKLTVRSGGRISGTIRYGSIIIEAGGEVSGDMKALVPGPSDEGADET